MIIVTQNNELINMDLISYIRIEYIPILPSAPYTAKYEYKYEVRAEDRDDYYTIALYDTEEEANKCVRLIRQGIEEDWRVCDVCED